MAKKDKGKGKGNDSSGGGRLTNGDDFVTHVHDDLGGPAYYDGRKGTDTFTLSFTREQWETMNGTNWALRDALFDFRAALLVAGGKGEIALAFGSLDITLKMFEAFEVTVAGEAVTLENALVSAPIIEAKAPENDPLSIDIAAYVTAADGIQTVTIDPTSAHEGTLTQDGNTVTFTPGVEFDYLQAGETATVSFDYTVTDANGDTASAEARIVVEGENDAPEARDITVATIENASSFAPVSQTDGARTVVNAGGFYILDADTGAVTFLKRDLDNLTPESVAPTNGAVVYINPNTSNWFIEAWAYSEGEATAVAPADLVVSGYDGPHESDADTLFFMDSGVDISVTIPLPTVFTPTGEATGTITLDGLSYTAFDTKIVDVGGVTFDLVPDGTEPDLIIAPDVTDADAGDVVTISVDQTDTLGQVTVDAEGNFVYDQGNAFGYLAGGEVATDSFRYTATDEAGEAATATVTVEVTGTNDAPDARALDGEVYVEASNVTAQAMQVGAREVPNAGTYYVLDFDTGSLTTVARDGSNSAIADIPLQNGVVLLVNPNTQSTYVEAMSYEMGVGSTVDPSELLPSGFTGEYEVYGDRMILLDAVDGGSISVSLEGMATPDGFANAALTLTDFQYAGPGLGANVSVGGANAAVKPGEVPLTVTFTADVFDLDDDVFTFSLDTTGTQGSVIDNGDGTFTYDATGAFSDLGAGATALDTFAYTVFDSAGASDTEIVTVTAIGTVDDELLFVS